MIPEEAYKYAVDYYPSEEIKKIACEDPGYAYLYAMDVDQGSGDYTRKAACRNSYCAYYYALYIDKGFHEDTLAAVRNTEWEEEYEKFFNSFMKEEII